MEHKPLCEQCRAKGLAIFPVRYTAVQKTLQTKLPSWANSAQVTSVKLDSETQYALRTLRAGYLYVYIPKGNTWHCYTITIDGVLQKQYSPLAAKPLDDKPFPVCKTHGADNTGVHYFVIEKADTLTEAYIAFSQFKWSPETLSSYEKDAAQRSQRMQQIDPSAMLKGTAPPSGTAAKADALEQVIEYQPTAMDLMGILYDETGIVPTIAKDLGQYSKQSLARCDTRYTWAQDRCNQASRLANHMAGRATQAQGSFIMALWDAVGITHELNNYFGAAHDRYVKYIKELEKDKLCHQSITGLKEYFFEAAKDEYVDHKIGHPVGKWQSNYKMLRERVLALPNAKEDLEEMARHSKYMRKVQWHKYDAFTENNKKIAKDAQKLVDDRVKPLLAWIDAPLFKTTLKDCHPDNLEDGLNYQCIVEDALLNIGVTQAGKNKMQAWANGAPDEEGNLFWRSIALNNPLAIKDVKQLLKKADENKDKPYTFGSVAGLVESIGANLFMVYDVVNIAHKEIPGVLKSGLHKPDAVMPRLTRTIINKSRRADVFLLNILDALSERFSIPKYGPTTVGMQYVRIILGAKSLVAAQDLKNMYRAEEKLLLQTAQSKVPGVMPRGVFYGRDNGKFYVDSKVVNEIFSGKPIQTRWDSIINTHAGQHIARDIRIASWTLVFEALKFMLLASKKEHTESNEKALEMWACGLKIISWTSDLTSMGYEVIDKIQSKVSPGAMVGAFGEKSSTFIRFKSASSFLLGAAWFIEGFISAAKGFEKQEEHGFTKTVALLYFSAAFKFGGGAYFVYSGWRMVSPAAVKEVAKDIKMGTDAAKAAAATAEADAAAVRAAAAAARGTLAVAAEAATATAEFMGRLLIFLGGSKVMGTILVIITIVDLVVTDELEDWLTMSSFGKKPSFKDAQEAQAELHKALVSVGFEEPSEEEKAKRKAKKEAKIEAQKRLVHSIIDVRLLD
jgi:hypothetical protein